MKVYASAIILLFCTFSGIVYAKSVLNIVDTSHDDVAAAISLRARIKNKKSHNDVNVSFESLIDLQDLHRIVNILVNSPYYVNDQANNENHGITLQNMGVERLLGPAATGGSSSAPSSMPVKKCDYLLRYLIEAYQEVIETMQSSVLSRRRIDEIYRKIAQMEKEDWKFHEKVDSMEDSEKRRRKHKVHDITANDQLPDEIYDYDASEEDTNAKRASKMGKTDSLFDHEDRETEDTRLQEKIDGGIKELKKETQERQSEEYKTAENQQPHRQFSDDIDDDDESEMEVENMNLKNETGFIKNCSMVPIMQSNNSVPEEAVTQNLTTDSVARASKVKFSDDESDHADYKLPEEYPENATSSSLGNRPNLEQQIHEDREEHLQGAAENGTTESNAVKKAEVKKPVEKVSLGNSLRMIKRTSILRKHQQEGTQVKSWNKTARYSGVVYSDKDDAGNKLSVAPKKPIFMISPAQIDDRKRKSSDFDGSHTRNQSGHVMEELIRAMQTGGRPQQKINQPGIGNQNVDDFQNAL